jgi:hypothetical protein
MNDQNLGFVLSSSPSQILAAAPRPLGIQYEDLLHHRRSSERTGKRIRIASEVADHQLQHIHRQRVQDGRCAVVTTYQLPHRCAELGWEQVVLLTRPVRPLETHPRSGGSYISRNARTFEQNATQWTTLAWPVSVTVQVQVATSHSRTVLSELPLTSVWPSGENETL